MQDDGGHVLLTAEEAGALDGLGDARDLGEGAGEGVHAELGEEAFGFLAEARGEFRVDLAHAVRGGEGAGLAHFLGRGDAARGEAHAGLAFEVAQLAVLALAVQDDGGAGAARAARAAGAVHVGLGVVGHVVLHDEVHLGDVEAARGDVGRDEHADASGAEGAEGALALALGEVAVERLGLDAAVDQLDGELVGLTLGAGEDDGALGVVDGEQVREDAGADAAHLDREVLDGLRGLRGAAALADEVDDLGVALVLAGDALHAVGEGSAEQHRLALLGDGGEDRLDGVREADAEHLVGLVEDDDLDVRQVEVAALDVVDDASGRADDDVDAALQRLLLRAVGGAAVDGERGEVRGALLELGGDLLGELAGRREDDRAGRAAVGAVRLEARRDGQGEREGLAGAGAGAADDVTAFEGQGERLLLDGGGLGDAACGERLRERGRDEFAELHGGPFRESLRSPVLPVR